MITTTEIAQFNNDVCSSYGTTFGIRDKNLYESLVPSMNQTLFGQDAYPTNEDKIAFLVSSIAKNHVFVDGNKRTAVIVYSVVCHRVGINKRVPKEEMFNIIQNIVTSPFNVENTKSLLFPK